MPPPNSAADPYLGFNPRLCEESSVKHSYSSHVENNAVSSRLVTMDPAKQLTASSESMNFATAMQIAQLESDEYLFAAAHWWARIQRLFEASADALRRKADAMTEFWDSAAAKTYFQNVGGAIYSMDVWAHTAGENISTLRALGYEVRTYQREIKKIWQRYVGEAGEYSDQVGRGGYTPIDPSLWDDVTGLGASTDAQMAANAETYAMHDARPWVEKLQAAFANAGNDLNFGHAHYQGPSNALPPDLEAFSKALGKHLAESAGNNAPVPPTPATPAVPAGRPNSPASPPTPPEAPNPPRPPAHPREPPPAPPTIPPGATRSAPAFPLTPPRMLNRTPTPNAPSPPRAPGAPPIEPPTAPAPADAPPARPNPLGGRSNPTAPAAPQTPTNRSPLSGRGGPHPPPLPTGRSGTTPASRGLSGRQSNAASNPVSKPAGDSHPPFPGSPHPPGRVGRAKDVQLPGRAGDKSVRRAQPASFPDDATPPPARPGASGPEKANPALRGRGTSSVEPRPGADREYGARGGDGAGSTPAAAGGGPATRPARTNRRTPIIDALAPNTATTDLGGRPRQPAAGVETPDIQREALRPGLEGHRYAEAEPAPEPGARLRAVTSRQPTYETNESEQEKPWTVESAPEPVITPADEATPIPDRSALGARE